MSARCHTYSDAAAAAEACAHHILALLEEVLSGNEFATMAISGGSTPKLMFPKLAEARFAWSRVHLFWVDERCVPPTDSDSDDTLALETRITSAHMPRRRVQRIWGSLPPKIAVKRYVEE